MKILTKNTYSATASGKTILIGEHSVVYGHKAVALALPDMKLKMTLFGFSKNEQIENWNQSWITNVRDQAIIAEERVYQMLTKAFERALSLCGLNNPINQFFPQKITIHSDIPLGGGMGGSAAISTCLMQIAIQIAQEHNPKNKDLSFEDQIQYSNEIDCIFHFGKASGLDTATVASNGIIEYEKGKLPSYIKNKCDFWLALVDSKERGETALMVKKVAENLQNNPKDTQKALENLGELAEQSIIALNQGKLNALADSLNQAQLELSKLGVSTDTIENIVNKFKNAGAMAAKLSGAGGGGIVLGLFDKKPENLYSLFDKDSLFITRVLKNANNF